MKVIETDFCPECNAPISHEKIIMYNNDFEDLSDVISQSVKCIKCSEYFEVIYAPIKMIKLTREDCTEVAKSEGEKDG